MTEVTATKKSKLKKALLDYQKGKISAWRAAQFADVHLWKFLEILKEQGIGFKTAEREIEKTLTLK